MSKAYGNDMKTLILEKLRNSVATLQKVMADEALLATLAAAAELTGKAMLDGRKLMIAGNGGSAADAQHLAAEFVSRLTIDRPAMRAVALTTDSSILTAVGNDYSYDNVFERQIEALGQKGDVFLGISTSGNSKNILKAFELSRKMGITTVGFSGRQGGKMPPLCDYNIIVPSEITANIQESHLALEHIFCHLVELRYFGAEFFAQGQ
ncbi:MAG: D-sedoheptulose 7-phosphate isomerase [Terracidiphilus sp.]